MKSSKGSKVTIWINCVFPLMWAPRKHYILNIIQKIYSLVNLNPTYLLQVYLLFPALYSLCGIYSVLIDLQHHKLSCWSTCPIEIHLSTRLRLMTSAGWKTEKLPLPRMQYFFGSMWSLHCSWFSFSWKSFMLGVNKFFCIHVLLPLQPT